MEETINLFLADLRTEYNKAKSKHTRDFSSPHEGYAVILEELDELWDEVKMNPAKMGGPAYILWKDRQREEAIQISAMCMRYVLELC